MYLNKMYTIHHLSWSCQSDLHLRSVMKNTNTSLDRPLVRAGGTGGMPPVNFEQRVASTRPEITNLSSTFSMYLYGSDLDKKM